MKYNLIFFNFSLKADRSLANGLEYKLFYLLEAPIKNNLEILLNEQRFFIDETNLNNLYTVSTYLVDHKF